MVEVMRHPDLPASRRCYYPLDQFALYVVIGPSSFSEWLNVRRFCGGYRRRRTILRTDGADREQQSSQ